MMTIVEVDSGEVVQSMQVLAEGCFPVVNVAVLSKNRGFLCPFFVAWMPFGQNGVTTSAYCKDTELHARLSMPDISGDEVHFSEELNSFSST